MKRAKSAKGPFSSAICDSSLIPLVLIIRSGRDDGEPERATGRANPLVEAEDGEVRDPGARDHGTGEMERVEGPDGLDGKGPSSALDDISLDPHDAPAPGRRCQVPVEPNCVSSGEGARGLPPDEDAVTFDQREVGCQYDFGPGERVPDEVGPRLAEQPAEDRAGLRVEVQRSPRSSSMSRWSSPGLRSLGMRR